VNACPQIAVIRNDEGEIMNEIKYPRQNVAGVLVGMLVGGLAGAVTMLLLAPQSGADTRKQIQEKSIELRDRTSGIMEDTLAQVRTSAQKLQMSAKDYGKLQAAEQLDNLSEAAQAGKKAVERL
jgi:gas vesicle protein